MSIRFVDRFVFVEANPLTILTVVEITILFPFQQDIKRD